jgi:excisionase family DNA binding protein
MSVARDPDAFLTAQQAADEIGFSVRTIWYYCRDNADPRIPHKRIGGRIRIRRRDLHAWLDRYTDQWQRRHKTGPKLRQRNCNHGCTATRGRD